MYKVHGSSSALGFFQCLTLPRLACFSLAPSPASGVALPSSRGHHGWLPVLWWLPSLSDFVYLWPSQRFSSVVRAEVQARQRSRGHQFAVRASWQQLLPREALPNAEHCPGSPHWYLLPFSSVRIPFANQPASYGVWLQIWPWIFFEYWPHWVKFYDVSLKTHHNNKRCCCLHVFALFWQKLHLVEVWTDCWPLL